MVTYDSFLQHKAAQLISDVQKSYMLHALGYDQARHGERIYFRAGQKYFRPYRNYYDAGGNDVIAWNDLVDKGIAEKSGSGYYHVTNKGLDCLSALIRTYIYSDNSDCVADAKNDVIDILIADACYCGYGCWIPTATKDIARRARLPLQLTKETLKYLSEKGYVARTHYGEIDDEGFPHCWHGFVLTAAGKAKYKERYDAAWKRECEYINKSLHEVKEEGET